MNIRVADIQACYELWRSRGAEFITEPKPKYGETRCYIRDRDGYIIEVGQSNAGVTLTASTTRESIPSEDSVMRAQILLFCQHRLQFRRLGCCHQQPDLCRNCAAEAANEILRPLLMFHSFRFVGLSFLVPGVVSPDLPATFAEGAAYGDIVAAALALLTLALLPGRLGIVAAWVFNLWGSADILHANYEGIRLGVQAGQNGRRLLSSQRLSCRSFWITHGLMFWLLLRNENEAAKVPAPRDGSPKVSRV